MDRRLIKWQRKKLKKIIEKRKKFEYTNEVVGIILIPNCNYRIDAYGPAVIL